MLTAANKERQIEAIREEWIKVMEIRLVRDELQKCHRAEGENHYQVCAPIVQVYTDLLKEAKVRHAANIRSRATVAWTHNGALGGLPTVAYRLRCIPFVADGCALWS